MLRFCTVCIQIFIANLWFSNSNPDLALCKVFSLIKVNKMITQFIDVLICVWFLVTTILFFVLWTPWICYAHGIRILLSAFDTNWIFHTYLNLMLLHMNALLTSNSITIMHIMRSMTYNFYLNTIYIRWNSLRIFFYANELCRARIHCIIEITNQIFSLGIKPKLCLCCVFSHFSFINVALKKAKKSSKQCLLLHPWGIFNFSQWKLHCIGKWDNLKIIIINSISFSIVYIESKDEKSLNSDDARLGQLIVSNVLIFTHKIINRKLK